MQNPAADTIFAQMYLVVIRVVWIFARREPDSHGRSRKRGDPTISHESRTLLSLVVPPAFRFQTSILRSEPL